MREQIARILMEARPNGGCIVRDWEAEGRDNPHVATALAQADAILPLMEKVAQAAIDASAEVIAANVISYETNGVVLRPRIMQDATSQTYSNAIRALSASEIVKEMCGE